MYPALLTEFFIKGCRDNFFLFSIQTFQQFPINNLQAEIISFCRGDISTKEIYKNFQKKNISLKALRLFLKSLKESGFINLASKKQEARVDLNSRILKIKEPYLKEVHLDLTKNCNLRCLYCYQEPYIGKNLKGTELTLDWIKLVIDDLSQMNTAELIISGGEPFLVQFLPEIIDYANSKGIATPTIFTNGTVFGKNIEFIKSRKKPTTLAISLDGHNEEIHNFSRGSNSYNEVINFIQSDEGIGDNKHIKIVIDTVITPANYRHLKEMYLFLGNLKKIFRWRVSMPREQGRFLENEPELQINPDLVLLEYKKFIEWYVTEGQFMFPDMSIQVESIFRSGILKGEKISTFSKKSNCCEYKANAMTIKPNGDITACTAFTNLVLGNIKDDSVSTIWKSQKMQDIKQLKVQKVKDCQDCPELYLCGSGCRKVAYDNGGINSKDESACKIYKFFNTEIIPIFKNLGLDPFEQ